MVKVSEEISPKRAFIWAVEWPGWCRGGKTIEEARERLVAVGPRYSEVARIASFDIPSVDDLTVVDSVTGGSGTEFGVPSVVVDDDRRPVTASEARRLASLVEASWHVFERVATEAPETLRKGPRGGGRDTAKMIAHVVEADHAYAREIGVRLKAPTPDDSAAVWGLRMAMLEVLRLPSDGSPLADRKWPLRYAARRIAWHALDHAWEIEDRTER